MAFTLVNKVLATGATATGGSAAPGWTMAAGDLVVVGLGLSTAAAVISAPTLTDSAGNAYTLRVGQPTHSACPAGFFLFDSVMTTGGAGITLNASFGGQSAVWLLGVLEYSFAAGAAIARESPVSARSDAGSNSVAPGTLTLSGAGRMVVAGACVNAQASYTPSTGYTVELSSIVSTDGKGVIADDPSASGTTAPSIAMNTSATWAACALAYYESFGVRLSYPRGRSVLAPHALTNADYVGSRYGD